MSPKKKLTLSIDSDVVATAKNRGINISDLTENVLRSIVSESSEEIGYNAENFDKEPEIYYPLRLLGPYRPPRINWAKFTEMELQTILKIHYEELGFNVRWIHLEDKAHEKGIDLVCWKAEPEKIGIAVKKNPKKGDIYQLQELANSKYKERIFVYVGKCSRSFSEALTKHRNVAVLNEEGLEELLQTSRLLHGILIDNTELMFALSYLGERFFLIAREEKRVDKPTKYNREILKKLWHLKDRVVTLHRCSRMFDDLFEKDDIVKKIGEKQLLDISMSFLGFMFYEALNPFLKSVDDDVWNLIRIDYLENRDRSDWFTLLRRDKFFQPGRVLENYVDYEKGRESYEEMKRKFGWSDFQVANGERYSHFAKALSTYFWALEEVIDDCFKIVMR